MSNISDKFKIELINFFQWVEHSNYIITNKDGYDFEWSLNLAPDYIEPGRNKMCCFIEEILKNYSINLDDTEIVDVKQMVSNFKNYKPIKVKRAKKQSPCKKESSVKTKKLEKKSQILVNDLSLDTSCNGMLYDLYLTTKQLENIFGCKAHLTGDELTDHRYEWKFTFKNIVYSIYDWRYIDETFDDYLDNDWFLGGDSDNQDNIKLIIETLNNMLSNNKSEMFVYDDTEEVSKVLVL